MPEAFLVCTGPAQLAWLAVEVATYLGRHSNNRGMPCSIQASLRLALCMYIEWRQSLRGDVNSLRLRLRLRITALLMADRSRV